MTHDEQLHDLQTQLLAVLVMDFGYEAEPEYNRTPLRHQIAWVMATEGRETAAVKADVATMRAQAIKEHQDQLKLVTMAVTVDRCSFCEGERWWSPTSSCPAGWHRSDGIHPWPTRP